MQPTAIVSWWPWFLGLSLLALLGIFLTWRGLYPRRRGTTPHCRKCGYNLTGLALDAADARCPECGTDVAADEGVVLGERIRRWRRVAVGVLLFLIAVTPLVVIGIGAARGVDWYRFKPTALVLRDIHSSDAQLAQRAVAEITRRFNGAFLSASQVHRLADACLAEQRRPNFRWSITRELINVLGTMYLQRNLLPEQREQFVEHLCLVRIVVRPTVILGQPCPVEVGWQWRGPSGVLAARLQVGERLIDGELVSVGRSREHDLSGEYLASFDQWSVGIRGPGRHEFSAEVEVKVYDSNTPSDATGDLVRTISRTLTAECNVLEREPADYIKLVRSPELDAAVKHAVRVDEVRVGKSWTPDAERQLECYFKFDENLPIGVAFDVSARFDGQSLKMGSLHFSPAGMERGFTIVVVEGLQGEPPQRVTLILKSSKEAAQRSVDLFEIWDGELRFEVDLRRRQLTPVESRELESLGTPYP